MPSLIENTAADRRFRVRRGQVAVYWPTSKPPANGLDLVERQRLLRLLARPVRYPRRSGGEPAFARYGRLRRQLALVLRRAARRRLRTAEARAALALADAIDQQRGALVQAHWPLCLHKARRMPVYRFGHSDREESIDAASDALLCAIENFDPAAGIRFSTYASWAMFAHLRRARRRAARAPENGAEAVWEKAVPSGALPLAETLIAAEDRARLWAAVDRLPPRAGRILRLRFLDGLALDQIGIEVGISKEGVRQTINRTVAVLGAELSEDPAGAVPAAHQRISLERIRAAGRGLARRGTGT